jgi:hypothetical protein
MVTFKITMSVDSVNHTEFKITRTYKWLINWACFHLQVGEGDIYSGG